MLKLHHFPGTRSSKVLWAALEMGAPVETQPVNLLQGEHKGPAHRERHPHGKVPAFEDTDHGVQLIESGAILQYLVEHFDADGKMLPADRAARAQCYQWCAYGNATLEVPIIGAYLQQFTMPEDKRDAAAIERRRQWVDSEVAPFLSAALGDKPHLCGDFTLADVAVGYPLKLCSDLGWLEPHATLAAYVARVTERPHYKTAFPPRG